MRHALKRITAPTVEPVSLEEIKAHVRVDEAFTADDTYLTGLISAARAHIEKVTFTFLCPQVWELILDKFPGGVSHNVYFQKPYFGAPIERINKDLRQIEIPIGPVTSVASVKYKNMNGIEYTMSADDYVVDLDSEIPRVHLVSGATWPSPSSGLQIINSVYVRINVGYPLNVSTPTAPEDLKAAVKLLAAHWYENRETAQEADLKPMPFAVDALLANYRRFTGEL